MSNLHLSNKSEKIESIFELLGEHENDMTYSLAWGLVQCPEFLDRFLYAINQKNIKLSEVDIYLQKGGDRKEGITDIELRSPKFSTIIEAKRGWNVPSKKQLIKYAKRLLNGKKQTRRLIVLSEYSKENSGNRVKNEIKGIPVQLISWREAIEFAKQSLPDSSHAQKHLINELIIYFNKIMTKQKYDSNWVYVVALNANKMKGWRASPVDTATKSRIYFHPIGKKGWPKEPPNYIAFRYGGKLQSIHHIDKYETTSNLKKWLTKDWPENMYLYTLGPAIRPSAEIKTGRIYPNGRVWCMLDTLLTSKTISQARDISKKRK